MDFSENIQMYLVVIALLGEDHTDPYVPLAQLAEELGVQSVSVNQMIRKLDDDKLVDYKPYKGVALTATGRQIALKIIRNRRLWEVFFVEQLGFPPSEADLLACQIEHIADELLTERLSKFLGEPAFSPQGKRIPDSEGKFIQAGFQPLTQIGAGKLVEVVRLDLDEISQKYLYRQGFLPGREIQVLAVSNTGDCLLSIQDKKTQLSQELAQGILVRGDKWHKPA